MRMRNVGSFSIKLDRVGLGTGEIPPGECVELPDHVCKPQRTAGGGRESSIVENLCNGALVPDDDEERAAWLLVPELPKPEKKPQRVPSVDEVMARDRVARGVAELIVAELAAKAHGVELHKALEGELRPRFEQSERALEAQREAHEKALAERVREITDASKQLAERDAKIAELQAQIAERDAQIAELTKPPEQPATSKKGR
jgi:hypothetical protein